MKTAKPTAVLDIETYRDYLLVAFLDVSTGVVSTFEADGTNPLPDASVRGIRRLLATCRVVTFNGNSFDLPLLTMALNGSPPPVVKAAADRIILENSPGWMVLREAGMTLPAGLDHVDLIEVAPGQASLKIYGGRLHCRRLQDLPIAPDASIAPDQRALLREYCTNDLTTTADLLAALTPQIELRERMSVEYGVDLRSRSDAQIAEIVICAAVTKASGRVVPKPPSSKSWRFKYAPPAWIRFNLPVLQRALADIVAGDFVVDAGKLVMPDALAGLAIQIGGQVYRLGVGGLHSSEQRTSHRATADTLLVDHDVESYYPSIILQCGLEPSSMRGHFLRVYRGLVEERLTAKHEGNTVKAAALKLAVNGSFGKLGSQWSRLYAPELLAQVTMTGQLALLMLIEALEADGVPVVSANTDGIVVACPVALRPVMDFAIWLWEHTTGLHTAATPYAALYSRDVNNYIAVKPGGAVKCKGAYATGDLMKNPANEICVTAVVRHLTSGTPIEQTVAECDDVRKFLSVRQVQGGAVAQDGSYLGKAVRWYYSTAVSGAIRYKRNGYTVPRTEGGCALMTLPDAVPADLDRGWYVREATAILNDIGAPV